MTMMRMRTDNSILIYPIQYGGKDDQVSLEPKALEELRAKLACVDGNYNIIDTYVADDGGLYALLDRDPSFPYMCLSNSFYRDSHQWRRPAYYQPAVYVESLSTLERGHKYVEASSYWYVQCRQAVMSNNFSVINRVFDGMCLPLDFAFNVLQAFLSMDQLMKLLTDEYFRTEQFEFELVTKDRKPLINITCLRGK